MVVLSRSRNNQDWHGDFSLTVDRVGDWSWLILLDSLYNNAIHDKIVVDGSILSLVNALARIHAKYHVRVTSWVWIGHVIEEFGYSFSGHSMSHHVCAFSRNHYGLGDTTSENASEELGSILINDGWMHYQGSPLTVSNHTDHDRHNPPHKPSYTHNECPYTVRNDDAGSVDWNDDDSFSSSFRMCFSPESGLFGYTVSIAGHNETALNGSITHDDGITYDELMLDLSHEYDAGHIGGDYVLDILDTLTIMSPVFKPGIPMNVARENMIGMFPELAERTGKP